MFEYISVIELYYICLYYNNMLNASTCLIRKTVFSMQKYFMIINEEVEKVRM